MKTVWILGAGFSRPLGGPLLTELLSPGSREELDARFPGADFMRPPFAQLFRLYRFGHRKGAEIPLIDEADRSLRLIPIWGDAEEFLSYLDVASSADVAENQKHPACVRIGAMLAMLQATHLSVTSASELARTYVAAECSAFLSTAEPLEDERWSAHLAWAKALAPDHTILTFNYDRVPELLRDTTRQIGRPRLHIVNPRGTDASDEHCNVLKLHGSLNWDLEDGTVHDEPRYWLTSKGSGIATPGPNKAKTVEMLHGLWDLAEAAISRAAAVVFVGFRFPPSDMIAKQRLLLPLANGERKAEEHLGIHIVLGEPGKDTARLAHMTTEMCRRSGRRTSAVAPMAGRGQYTVTVHPLFAEDFFAVYSEEMLGR